MGGEAAGGRERLRGRWGMIKRERERDNKREKRNE